MLPSGYLVLSRLQIFICLAILVPLRIYKMPLAFIWSCFISYVWKRYFIQLSMMKHLFPNFKIIFKKSLIRWLSVSNRAQWIWYPGTSFQPDLKESGTSIISLKAWNHSRRNLAASGSPNVHNRSIKKASFAAQHHQPLHWSLRQCQQNNHPVELSKTSET